MKFYEKKDLVDVLSYTDIYVHRRPNAEFSITRNGNKITLTSLSYDLDNYSNNNGISQEEWKYRKVGETTWTNGKLTDISGGNDLILFSI